MLATLLGCVKYEVHKRVQAFTGPGAAHQTFRGWKSGCLGNWSWWTSPVVEGSRRARNSLPSLVLPFLWQVDNIAAAVQPHRKGGAWLRGASSRHALRLHRPRDLQRGQHAFTAAASDGWADAQGPHAPSGKPLPPSEQGWGPGHRALLSGPSAGEDLLNFACLSSDFGPTGPDGHHQHQHAGRPADAGRPHPSR